MGPRVCRLGQNHSQFAWPEPTDAAKAFQEVMHGVGRGLIVEHWRRWKPNAIGHGPGLGCLDILSARRILAQQDDRVIDKADQILLILEPAYIRAESGGGGTWSHEDSRAIDLLRVRFDRQRCPGDFLHMVLNLLGGECCHVGGHRSGNDRG